MVMVLYQLGEYFQHRAVEKSRQSITQLMDIRPDFANVIFNDEIVIKSPAQIDFVYRGWLGDITYWAADGMDMNNPEKTNLTSESCCVKDVLCVRVNVKDDGNAPVMWEYVFLKY